MKLNKILLLAASILMVDLSLAETERPWSIDHLCGRIEHVVRAPERNNPHGFSEKRTPLRDVSLSLYQRDENVLCCDGQNPLEATRSTKGGNFEFKSDKPGNYWLFTDWDRKKSRVAVTYEPQKDAKVLCSDQGIQLDDQGNATWWVTVTVD